MILNTFLLRSMIYGGTDGIISIFNLISGIEGAQLNYKYIFILGLAVLIGDGISMGVGDYLSLNADIDYKKQNKKMIKNMKNVKPLNNSKITFFSFIIFGFIPLTIYLLLINYSKNNKFLKTFLSVFISLFILGSIQSKFTNKKWYINGIYTSGYGSLASLLSYNISKLISNMI